MSKAIRILNNEIIEIMDIVNANALFQTYEYPKDEIFYKLRKQINPFDLYYENENKDKEIERLNNIIKPKEVNYNYLKLLFEKKDKEEVIKSYVYKCEQLEKLYKSYEEKEIEVMKKDNIINELEIKSTKLKDFIILNEEFLKLDDLSRSLLQVQDNVMDAYISILDLRINHLKELNYNESN